MSTLLTHAMRVARAETLGGWDRVIRRSAAQSGGAVVGTCPACGQAIDHCPGHGMTGDPCGYAALQAHDEGDHTICHPDGCDQAGEGS